MYFLRNGNGEQLYKERERERKRKRLRQVDMCILLGVNHKLSHMNGKMVNRFVCYIGFFLPRVREPHICIRSQNDFQKN